MNASVIINSKTESHVDGVGIRNFCPFYLYCIFDQLSMIIDQTTCLGFLKNFLNLLKNSSVIDFKTRFLMISHKRHMKDDHKHYSTKTNMGILCLNRSTSILHRLFILQLSRPNGLAFIFIISSPICMCISIILRISQFLNTQVRTEPL